MNFFWSKSWQLDILIIFSIGEKVKKVKLNFKKILK